MKMYDMPWPNGFVLTESPYNISHTCMVEISFLIFTVHLKSLSIMPFENLYFPHMMGDIFQRWSFLYKYNIAHATQKICIYPNTDNLEQCKGITKLIPFSK